MIETLTFAVLAAVLPPTPCDGLKAISLPYTTITKSEFGPEGVFQPVPAPAPPAGTAPAPAPAPLWGRRRLQSSRPHIAGSLRF